MYQISSRAPVPVGESSCCLSPIVAELQHGTIVEVVQIVRDSDRWRGRVQEPLGWISLASTDGLGRWAAPAVVVEVEELNPGCTIRENTGLSTCTTTSAVRPERPRSRGPELAVRCRLGHTLERSAGQTAWGRQACATCRIPELGTSFPYFYCCKRCNFVLCQDCAEAGAEHVKDRCALAAALSG